MAPKIIKRPLEENEIAALVADTYGFPDLAYVSSKRWRSLQDPYCLTVGNRFAGVCAVFSFHGWVKLGPLVIIKRFQGKGFGDMLLGKVMRDNPHRNLFVSSSNPVVQHMLAVHGFVRADSFFRLAPPVRHFLAVQLLGFLGPRYVFEAFRKSISLKRQPIRFYIRPEA